jgi:propionyl-CoA carboxylase alpha chain
MLSRRASGQVREDLAVVVGDSQPRRITVSGEQPLVLTLIAEDRRLTLDFVKWRPGQALFYGKLDGHAFTVTITPAAEGFIVRHRAARARALVLSPHAAELHAKLPPRPAPDTSKRIFSPMPGLLVTLNAEIAQHVREGDVIGVIEAMKMQNIIRAERDGVIAALGAVAGDSVAADQMLVEFAG